MRNIILFSALLIAFSSVNAQTDFTKGVFIVNEDWYGHQNSTVNYLMPDAADEDCWFYRAFQDENDGCQLGATNQFANIFNGKFYFIAKQPQDPGSSIKGGRITVADAKTLKLLYQTDVIDPSGNNCAGRGFLGVNEHKGYVSTSNGIWVMDLETYAIMKQVAGTENPYAVDGSDPYGALYYGQSGTMVNSEGKVFAAHQEYGCLVLDPESDEVIDSIPLSFVPPGCTVGSIVKSADGYLWLSIAADKQGTGGALPYFVKVDPVTLKTTIVEVPDSINPPSNTWFAWTPDSFCASSKCNKLFWSCSSSRWFGSQDIYSYDIDNGVFKKIVDLEDDGEGWKVYGCSMRVHPRTDEIYVSLYKDCSSTTYLTRRYTSDGVKLRDYPMVSNYWFPSIPVFPEIEGEIGISNLDKDQSSYSYLNGCLKIENAGSQQVKIYNVQGELVHSYPIASPHFTCNPHLAPGIYVIVFDDNPKKLIIN